MCEIVVQGLSSAVGNSRTLGGRKCLISSPLCSKLEHGFKFAEAKVVVLHFRSGWGVEQYIVRQKSTINELIFLF